MNKFNHKKIDKKWQKYWQDNGINKTREVEGKEKYYVLDMFPYPSGAGLHVGHPKGYIASDVTARMKMMQGLNVLHPMGWDAFGLPAENYAIKNKVHPKKAVEKNVQIFKKQLNKIGFTYDWEREVNTTDPEYFKWTQWAFIKMFEKGLAYESAEPIIWCPSCKTGLAMEDLEAGKCERCGSEVEKKPMRQWVLKIKDYADRLLYDLDKLNDWPEPIKEMQRNWIGRSEGAEINFRVKEQGLKSKEKYINIFTTRPDTLFGATFMVLAPEHPLVAEITIEENKKEVEKYAKLASAKSDLERSELQKDKSGVFTGSYAINPVNGKEIPIWVADYVLMGYGTGAIMAVPAHDQRDFDFAKKYNLPIEQVISPMFIDKINPPQDGFKEVCRDTVLAFLRDKSTGKYALLDWHGTLEGITTTIMGGIDEGESVEEAARKEIAEEAGLDNLTLVEKSRWVTEAKYCASHKKENRHAIAYALLFEVENLKNQKAILDEEKSKHTLYWVSEKEVLDKLVPVHQKFVWQQLLNETALVDDGHLINSGEFDGLAVKDSMKKIITWLEDKNIGKAKVNYKLQDWVFSRQRYWGEPIPIIHCENCKNKKNDYVILHGYSGTGEFNGSGAGSGKNWRSDLKEKLEMQGNKVFLPDLPNTEKPNIDEQVQYVLDNVDFEIDENTIIVAHSLGAVVVYKLLEKIGQKINNVYFIDPVFSPNFGDKERPDVNKSNDWNFKIEKIKPLANYTIIGASDFSTILEKDLKELANKLDANLILAKPEARHFTSNIESVIEQIVINNKGVIPVPEKDLPVVLPTVKSYEPTGTGESPLAGIDSWVNVKCPNCGGAGKRETNTMPQWAGSNWYYLRYVDPNNSKALIDPVKEKYWMPVDFYIGGAEHATRHLIYSRFWHKFLFDIGVVSSEEPFKRFQNVGLIMAEDGRKMSKRWGNVINPDDVIEEYGADAFRTYEMFMGPFDQPVAWDTNGLRGVKKFLDKVDSYVNNCLKNNAFQENDNKDINPILHKTIKKVTEDINTFNFNTAVSQMMIFINEIRKDFGKEIIPGKSEQSIATLISKQQLKMFLQCLAPFAPHLVEELWQKIGEKESIFLGTVWPKFDESLIVEDTIEMPIQINGKLREKLLVSLNISEVDLKKMVLGNKQVQRYLEGKELKKFIYIKNRLVSLVI